MFILIVGRFFGSRILKLDKSLGCGCSTFLVVIFFVALAIFALIGMGSGILELLGLTFGEPFRD